MTECEPVFSWPQALAVVGVAAAFVAMIWAAANSPAAQAPKVQEPSWLWKTSSVCPKCGAGAEAGEGGG